MTAGKNPKTPRPLVPTAGGGRLWLFRLLAAVALPLALLTVAELALRLAGYGYPASFLVPVPGRAGVLTTNQRFGWRFFPRHLAREPVPLEITRLDEAERERVFRIFVVGGSAARGTPDSAYSFGRVLEVMLRRSFPDTRFEVHNAAMTAINSHVVLPIVRDCARQDPDLFVVYLGNNEVVGPYGAATVFRPFSPSLGLIRAGGALRATRLGQLLDRTAAGLTGALGKGSNLPREWRGMEMFLERRVAFGDPRLEVVYAHLRRNLGDLVRVSEGAGARTLLATVAVNLRDLPPFASLHRPDLADADRERWQELFDAGSAALDQGRHQDAEASFAAAAALDGEYADLHYRLARARAALGRADEALAGYRRARDLDALRFRADSHVNRIVREVAADRGVLLADAESAFGAASEDGIPGSELFYEHVHLTLAGNHLLARKVFEALTADRGLAAGFGRRAAVALPSVEEVAEELALTPFDAYDLEQEILAITSRPPFTGPRQSGLAGMRSALTAEAWRAAETLYRRQLERFPADLELRRRFALRLQARGRAADAAAEWRTLLEHLPGVPSWRSSLALALADSGGTRAAIGELEAILRDDPDSVDALLNLGTVFQKAGDEHAAIATFRRILEIVPDHGPASFNLGTALLESGAVDAAVAHFRELIAERPELAAAHHNLGHALERQGDLEGAIASYRRAVAADPTQAKVHNSLGLALEAAGEPEAAAAAYREALRHEPDYALAHFNLADLSLTHGLLAEAAAHYEDGLRYRPDNIQARYNLATAQALAGRVDEAVATLEQALAIARRTGDEGLAEALDERLSALRGLR